MDPLNLWKRYQDCFCGVPAIHFSLDISRMNFKEDFFDRMESPLREAFGAMSQLEKGAIANPDEHRMVGHYWLRAPELAPTHEIRKEIGETLRQIKQFARDVHEGHVTPERGGKFTDLLIIGIGGSALGPQFVSHALGCPGTDKLRVHFFDNTDPDGMDDTLASLKGRLSTTLTLMISKSGGTRETRNGQMEARHAYEQAGLQFSRHAVAITKVESELDRAAESEGWLRRFPMWDWVGGRTSVMSAVGLLPAALQGIDTDDMLMGARVMDEATRSSRTRENPAALLALVWFHATKGRGAKDMVVLPYKDRLLLFSRYLQQLVMESIGKERNLRGGLVRQGMTVYGNKGSTDQHALVQQLREGVHNFFVTFIEVLKDRDGSTFFVEPNVASGDYLDGFLQGTRAALYEKGRESVTLTIPDVSPRSIGALIALYERTVGLYASLVGINAYHQPGVEAGKKAAGAVLALQEKAVAALGRRRGEKMTADQLAQSLESPEQAETIFWILRHLAANPGRGIQSEGNHPTQSVFWM